MPNAAVSPVLIHVVSVVIASSLHSKDCLYCCALITIRVVRTWEYAVAEGTKATQTEEDEGQQPAGSGQECSNCHNCGSAMDDRDCCQPTSESSLLVQES